MIAFKRQSPAVSIVIPAYRSPDYLNQALESVRAQTFTDYEVVVVDDGSGDDCVSQYKMDENTRLIRHPETRGPAAARNTGIGESRGCYIALMDMDDIWLPDKLQTQVDALERNPCAGLAFCHYTLADENLKPLAKQPIPKKIGKSAFKRLLVGNIIKSCSVVMLRKEAIDECGLFDNQLPGTDDWDLWLRIAYDYEICFDPVPRVIYRVHSSQLSKDAAAMRRAEVSVMRKWLTWAECHNHSAIGLVRGQFCCRLQRLARAEARKGNLRAAVKALKDAVYVNPCDIRCYIWPAALLCLAARCRLLGDKPRVT